MKLKSEKHAEYQEIKKALAFAEQQVSFWRSNLMSCPPVAVEVFRGQLKTEWSNLDKAQKLEREFLLNDNNFLLG